METILSPAIRPLAAVALITSLALLSGCASVNPYAKEPILSPRPPTSSGPQAPLPGPQPRPTELPPPSVQDSSPQPQGAAAYLRDQALAHAQGEEWAAAANSMERAIRIEPANPWLYIDLAAIRMREGEWLEVEPLLERAMTLGGDDPRVAESVTAVRDQFERLQGRG